MSRKISVGVMIALAVWIRSYDLAQPVVTFHATRHYRSAMLARACYYDHANGIAPWAKAVAAANREMQPAGELPIMEWLACGTYLALGHEHVVLPRALASLAWVAGAVPVMWLGLRLASPQGAVVAVALYLFLPYGIIASRNFQPDPLMTLASLWALVAVVRHHERASTFRLLVAAALIGIAALIKPMSIFISLPVVISLGLARHRTSRTGYAAVGLILILGMLPAAIYYGYSAMVGTLARDQMRMRFVPSLLLSSFFWHGLFIQIERVVSVPLFAGGIIGSVFAPQPFARWILVSLFLGYAAFAVAFTYHMPTHDYYHLPYIAVVALGIAAVVASLQSRLAGRVSKRAVTIAVAGLCATVVVAGCVQALMRLKPSNDELLTTYEEIGALTAHSNKVLFLDREYGYPLMYHGQLSGDAWPNADDLTAEAVTDVAPISADGRFERDYAAFAPTHFVVTDLASLQAAPDLQAMLTRRTVGLEKTDRYQVYRFMP